VAAPTPVSESFKTLVKTAANDLSTAIKGTSETVTYFIDAKLGVPRTKWLTLLGFE